jgi:hypothetical protein
MIPPTQGELKSLHMQHMVTSPEREPAAATVASTAREGSQGLVPSPTDNPNEVLKSSTSPSSRAEVRSSNFDCCRGLCAHIPALGVEHPRMHVVA